MTIDDLFPALRGNGLFDGSQYIEYSDCELCGAAVRQSYLPTGPSYRHFEWHQKRGEL
jgi:hypothetical protein